MIQPIESSPDVISFPSAIIVNAFAQSGAAEIEAQHGQSESAQGFGGMINDFVVHCAAVQRMWVAHERSVWCARIAGVEQSLEPARRAFEK